MLPKKEIKLQRFHFGYADGIRRALSSNGFVLIRGKKAPIVGNICMDSFMVDVSCIPNISLGDEVTIWDNETITVEQIAKRCGTINYEILAGVSERVPRVYEYPKED